MRAAVFHEYGEADVLRVEAVAEPTVGPRDVLVGVRAASVNPVDCKIRHGYQRAFIRYRLPQVVGLDVAGDVLAVGARVTRFKVGDAVISSPTHRRPGTCAERVAIDESAVALKPPRLDYLQAAALPLAGLTAWARPRRRARAAPAGGRRACPRALRAAARPTPGRPRRGPRRPRGAARGRRPARRPRG